MPPKFEMSPSEKPDSKKEKTIEEIIEDARKKYEEAGGVPQVRGDLFGGDTLDERRPIKKRTRPAGIARAQKNPGPKNERRRGNIRLERMLPPCDR